MELNGAEAKYFLVGILEKTIDVLQDFTWSSFLIIASILLLIYFFTEFYSDKYTFSIKEKIGMFFTGITFIFISEIFGNDSIYFPIWGIIALLLFIDAKYQDLPDELNLLIAVFSIPVVVISIIHSDSYFEWTIFSGILLFLIFFAIALAGPLGGGDIKMMAAVGLYFPLYEVPQLIFFGFAAGVVHAIYLLIFTDAGMKTQFAFGPGLIVGILLTSIF